MEPSFFEEKGNSDFEFKRYLSKLANKYIWFVASLAIFFVAAKLYLTRQVPLYKVSTYALLSPEQYQPGLDGSLTTAQSSGLVDNSKDLIDNEIFILQSHELIAAVVDSLQLAVGITAPNGLKTQILNPDSLPFSVTANRPDPDTESPLYNLTSAKDSVTLQNPKYRVKGLYGEPLAVGENSVTIRVTNPAGICPANVYSFQLSGVTETINKYASRLSVSAVPKAGNGMVEVSLKDELPERAKKFIEVLFCQYNRYNLKVKNGAKRLAVDFLSKRLAAVHEELEKQENEASNFKAANKIYDVSLSANQLLTDLGEVDKQKSQNELKENLLNLVEAHIAGYNAKEEIVPNAIGLEDGVLIDLINRYNQLVLQKRMVLDQGTPDDPRLPTLNGQLGQIRESISKNVINIRNELQTNKKHLLGQENAYVSKFESLPKKEKNYIKINRALSVKEALYVFLLQKKEESSIQLVTSDLENSRIIDNGINQGTVGPKEWVVYSIAFAAALLLPAFIVLAGFLLTNKVQTRKEIERITGLPIIGEIGWAKKASSGMLAFSDSRSPVAEDFRNLRTNIYFSGTDPVPKVLLVTSYTAGEGKTFISLNTALALAVSQKKVVLVDLDLRNPILSQRVSIIRAPGVSDYLQNPLPLSAIIQPPPEEYSSLHFISSGTLCDHPSELLLNDRLEQLFVSLRQQFDAVVVDSPSVGKVSDATILSKMADATLYGIRPNVTSKASLRMLNEFSRSQRLKHLALVVNGIRKNSGYR